MSNADLAQVEERDTRGPASGVTFKNSSDKEIEVDDWLQDDYGWFRVMAIVQGWMMCMPRLGDRRLEPFVLHTKNPCILIPDENRQNDNDS